MVLSKLITVILYVFTSHLELEVTEFYRDVSGRLVLLKGKCSPYSITERRVPELIPVLGSQPVGDVPLLSAKPAVTRATLKRAATNFAAW